jgi:hypothetical protein
MKAFLVFIALMFATTSASLCDDFKMLDGKEYKHVTVSRREPDGIVITTNSGIIKLYFSELPPDVRAKYNYDPKKAQEFAAADARQQQLLREQTQRDRATIAQQQAASAAAAIAAAAARTAEQNKHDTASEDATPSQDAPHQNVLHGTALDQRPSGPKWFLQGHVVQVMEGEGILLHTVKSNTFGIPEPRDDTLVFVAGNFEPTLDWHDVLAMEAVEAGRHRYTTVQGVSKTVTAFQPIGSRTPVAPFVYDTNSRRYIQQ